MNPLAPLIRLFANVFYRFWVVAIKACAAAFILLCLVMWLRELWLAGREHRLLAFASGLLPVHKGYGLAILLLLGVSTGVALMVRLNARTRRKVPIRATPRPNAAPGPIVSFPMNLRPTSSKRVNHTNFDLKLDLQNRIHPIDPSMN